MNQTQDEDPSLYNANVASQFRPLRDLVGSDEIDLWFEYELFCSVNLWFCLSLVADSGAAAYLVRPFHLSYQDRWNGFANADAETLRECFTHRLRLNESEIKLGADLWRAFKRRDVETLTRLTSTQSAAYPYLDEVGRAAAQFDTLPTEILAEIKSSGINNFSEIFLEFRRRAGVFGFGDAQVKNIMARQAD